MEGSKGYRAWRDFYRIRNLIGFFVVIAKGILRTMGIKDNTGISMSNCVRNTPNLHFPLIYMTALCIQK